jgi:hypothetical protein
MRIVHLGTWILAISFVAGVLGGTATARTGRDHAQPRTHQQVRLTIHGGGSTSSLGGYRTSLETLASGKGKPWGARAAGSSSTSASTPTSAQAFSGISKIEAFEPADPTGAMGASFFVTAVNTRYAVWNLDGSQAVAPTLLDTVTHQDDGLEIFDPKIVYDEYRDTFVMVYLAQRDSPRRSVIVVTAIPDTTADQVDTWCTTTIQGDQVDPDLPTWADYPGLGFDGGRLVITTNEFTFPTSFARFVDAQVLAIKKDSLYDCNAPTVIGDVFAGQATRNEDGSKAFTIQPAQTVGSSPTAEYLLSFEGPGRGSFLTLWRLRLSSKGLRLKRTTLGVGRVAGNVVGTQAGGSLTDPDTAWDTGDQRLTNAWYDADRNALYAAHNVAKDLVPDTVTGGYLESVVRWYEIRPTGRIGRSRITREGIVGAAETDAGWPAVATDADGDLFITFSRGSEPLGEYISAWAAEIVPGSTDATLTELAPGTAVHDAIPNSIERWGDFNAIGRDPLDASRIAMVNQIAVPNDQWQQTVNVVTNA